MRDSEWFDETDRGISMVIHNDAIWDDQCVSEIDEWVFKAKPKRS